MNAKSTIRKLLFIGLWLCIGGAMFTLLLAAIGKKNKGVCRDFSITIRATNNNFFIDQKDITDLLVKGNGGNIRGKAVKDIDLYALENMLEQNTWISDAELYFDSQDVLHITINEKQPIARVFSGDTHSFYIDEEGNKMPLSDKRTARVPVFTGFPEAKKMGRKDSLLLKEVTGIANFINEHPFWKAQVVQIDITNDGSFEMIPLVGDHIVRLGNGYDIGQKFHRLAIFYEQVLRKTGFEKYRTIDVRYDRQVVVSGMQGTVKINKSAYQRNLEKLMKESAEQARSSNPPPPVVTGRYSLSTDSATAPVPELKEIEQINLPVKKAADKASNPNPLNAASAKKTAAKKDAQADEKTGKKVPKAVMPKRTVGEEENGGYN